MKQYQYKLKDKKAQIFKRVQAKTSKGVQLDYWRPFTQSPLWCYTQNNNGFIVKTNFVIETGEDRLFVFNFIAGVEQGDAIKYKDNWYKISRCYTFDDYNGDLFCYVQKFQSPEPKFILNG